MTIELLIIQKSSLKTFIIYKLQSVVNIQCILPNKLPRIDHTEQGTVQTPTDDKNVQCQKNLV